jgi:hypothetical protein
MTFSSSTTSFRISGAIVVLIGLLPVAGAVWTIRVLGWGGLSLLVILDILIPLLPGILGLLGRSAVFLPVAYGWLLARVVPKLLAVPQQMDLLRKEARTNHFPFPIGMYGYWGTLCAIALIGLAFYVAGAYRQDCHRKT